MANHRSIDIDFDVHKRIELERQSFSETPNTVLRRLLGIEETAPAEPVEQKDARPWAGKGVTLPHGTEVRMEYNGRVHSGLIDNGAWVIEGEEFESPSAAAGGAARTRAGKRTQLDGWLYWQVKRPGDTQWIGLVQLRYGK